MLAEADITRKPEAMAIAGALHKTSRQGTKFVW